jgi:hypothetical protein
VDERLTVICDRFDATIISAVDAYDRHCSSLRVWEFRLSSAAPGSEGMSSLLCGGHKIQAVEPKRRLMNMVYKIVL